MNELLDDAKEEMHNYCGCDDDMQCKQCAYFCENIEKYILKAQEEQRKKDAEQVRIRVKLFDDIIGEATAHFIESNPL